MGGAISSWNTKPQVSDGRNNAPENSTGTGSFRHEEMKGEGISVKFQVEPNKHIGSMIGQGRRHGFPTHSRTLEMADAEHTWLRQFYHEAAQRQVLMRIWIV